MVAFAFSTDYSGKMLQNKYTTRNVYATTADASAAANSAINLAALPIPKAASLPVAGCTMELQTLLPAVAADPPATHDSASIQIPDRNRIYASFCRFLVPPHFKGDESMPPPCTLCDVTLI